MYILLGKKVQSNLEKESIVSLGSVENFVFLLVKSWFIITSTTY